MSPADGTVFNLQPLGCPVLDRKSRYTIILRLREKILSQ